MFDTVNTLERALDEVIAELEKALAQLEAGNVDAEGAAVLYQCCVEVEALVQTGRDKILGPATSGPSRTTRSADVHLDTSRPTHSEDSTDAG